jgi:phosphate transport system substrate-binding protein
VKNAHVGVIPGIKEFVTEFVSEKAFGSDGYLTDKGLIPLPTADRAKVREASVGLTKLAM